MLFLILISFVYAECVDECELFDTKCYDNRSYILCADEDGDGCLEWVNSSQINCSSELVCYEGSCVDSSEIPNEENNPQENQENENLEEPSGGSLPPEENDSVDLDVSEEGNGDESLDENQLEDNGKEIVFWIFIILIILLVVAGFFAAYFIFRKKSENTGQNTEVENFKQTQNIKENNSEYSV